jgi:hypothetical protein
VWPAACFGKWEKTEMTPTQRTKALLKKQSIPHGVVEKWIQYAPGDPRRKFRPGERQDFMGIIDIIAVEPGVGNIGIQCCAGSGNSSHFKKLTVEKAEASRAWLEGPNNTLEIHAWRKVKKVRGGKAMIWRAKITNIKISDLK